MVYEKYEWTPVEGRRRIIWCVLQNCWEEIDNFYSREILSKGFQKGLIYLACFRSTFSVNVLFPWFLDKNPNKLKMVRRPCLNRIYVFRFIYSDVKIHWPPPVPKKKKKKEKEIENPCTLSRKHITYCPKS